jgi:predicted transcriptional regulator
LRFCTALHCITLNRIELHLEQTMSANSATLALRLPEALLTQLDQLAGATMRSKTFLAIEALKAYVERESWQIQDIHQGLAEADAGEFATDRQVKAVFAKYGA